MATIGWDFGGRTVLVTGASRGIGLATANLFAAAGAHVVAASRTGAAEGGHPGPRRLVEQAIPARRLGEPAEVAALIAFLAADEAAFVSGQTIVIDGAQLLV